MQKYIILWAMIYCAAFANLCGENSGIDFVEEELDSSWEAKGVLPPTKPIHKLVLVTGCARSGTTFIAEVLQHCGLNVVHEAAGKDGIVSWLMAARDTHTPYGPGYYNYRFKHIFHQVRDPLKTMASLTTEHAKAWQFVMKHTPQIKAEDPMIVKCAKYWYYWNKRAEAKAEWTYRVEDIENALEEMGRRMGIHLDKEAIHKVRKTINHRERTVEYTWAEVKANLSPTRYKKLIDLARKYGYSAPD